MGNIPRYQEIVRELETAVRNRIIVSGEQIAPVAELCEKYKVSHVTALRALRELSDGGILIRKPGQGYFAAGLAADTPETTIGVLLRNLWPRLSDNYTNEIFFGVQNEAARRKLNLLLDSAAGDAIQREAREIGSEVIRAARKMAPQVSGFLTDERISDETVSEMMETTGKPVVVVKRRSELAVNSVSPDVRKATGSMLEILLKMNYRHFLFVESGHPGQEQQELEESWETFRSGLPCSCRSEIFKRSHYVMPDEFAGSIFAYIRKLAGARTAIVCCADSTARTVCNLLTASGKTTPRDFGVTGFYGLLDSLFPSPALTTLKVNSTGIGKMAVELLDDAINGISKGAPCDHVIPTEFVPGETV